jgi:hypothetical protein
MKFQSSLALAALVMLSASSGVAQGAEAQPASSASSAVLPPPAGKGQVVFFRKSSLMGMPYWTNVREHDVAYGKLSNGSYFVTTLEPGVHEFRTSVLGQDSMRVEVDPGETYYVQGKITMAVLGYTVVMAPSDAETFQKVFKGMRLAKPEPAPAVTTPAEAPAK